MADVSLVEGGGDLTRVALSGRLDAAGVGAVDLKLTSQTVPRRKPVIIDLRTVEFIASLGIGMLVRIAQTLRAHGLRMAIVATGPVKGVLGTMGMGGLFPIVETPEEALRALGGE